MHFNILNPQCQFKTILFYCKLNDIKVDRKLFKFYQGLLTYDGTSIRQWYGFFDSVYSWHITKEGYYYWHNHQLRLAYFALHFKVEYCYYEEIFYYICDLLLRVKLEKLDKKLLTTIIQKFDADNLINKKKYERWKEYIES